MQNVGSKVNAFPPASDAEQIVPASSRQYDYADLKQSVNEVSKDVKSLKIPQL